MIVTAREYRARVSEIFRKSDHAILTYHGHPDKVCLKFDESAKVFIERAKAAHREAREYINES